MCERFADRPGRCATPATCQGASDVGKTRVTAAGVLEVCREDAVATTSSAKRGTLSCGNGRGFTFAPVAQKPCVVGDYSMRVGNV